MRVLVIEIDGVCGVKYCAIRGEGAIRGSERERDGGKELRGITVAVNKLK